MIKRVIKGIIKIICRCLPINKKKIIFSNFFAQGYNDNPKYITEELLRRNCDYKLVWILNDTSIELDERIIKVKYPSIRAIYEYSTSKMIVQNIRNFHINKKRKNQIYLQTWHGAGAFKKVEGQSENKLSQHYINEAKYDGLITDGIIADNSYSYNLFKKYFWLNDKAEILKTGSPSYDYIITNKNNIELINSLKNKYNIKDELVVLYAPTFRDDNSTTGYIKNFDTIIKSFNEISKRNIKIIVRFHPNVQKLDLGIKYNNQIVKSDTTQDIKELSLISDFLISDYSSVMYDFLLLDKPVFRYVNDIEDYRKMRGLPDEFFEYPFSLNQSIDDLNNSIKKMDLKEYYKELNIYNKSNNKYNDGTASSKIAEWINSKINK